MDEHVTDPVEAEAAAWVARRHGPGHGAADEAHFRQWRDASPGNAATYAAVASTLGRLRANASELRERIGMPSPPMRTIRPQRHRVSRRGMTAATLAMVAGGGLLGWRQWEGSPSFQETYATARGERLAVALPDGSRVEFDTATRAEVRLYPHRREVRLLEGQAMFTVQHDASHPFDVLAGGTRVTVVGTRFSVRHTTSGLTTDGVLVAVEQGRVRVAPLSGDVSAVLVELRAGESVVANVAGRPGAVASVAPGSVAPWREGRVSFDNTSLAQALAEFERYGATGLVIHDPAVAALRLGGSFEPHELSGFLQALPRLLPVRLKKLGQVTEIVSTR